MVALAAAFHVGPIRNDAWGNSPKRIALVIGNAFYPDQDPPLEEVETDASEVATELKRLGFDVEKGINLTIAQMREALQRFYSRISPGDIGAIFFDGFAIQSGRQTYLIPVDAPIWVETDVVRDGVSLETVLHEMNLRKASVKIALLDAARRSPFERRFRRYSAGLAPAITPIDTIVMYSTAPGSVISSTRQKRSFFVTELLKEIRVPNVKAEDTLRNVQAGVVAATNKEQIPWLSSTLTTPFSFTSPGADASASGKTDTACEAAKPDAAPSAEDLARDPTIADLSRRITANSADARFTGADRSTR